MDLNCRLDPRLQGNDKSHLGFRLELNNKIEISRLINQDLLARQNSWHNFL